MPKVLTSLLLLCGQALGQSLPSWVTRIPDQSAVTPWEDEQRLLDELPEGLEQPEIGQSAEQRPIRIVRYSRTDPDSDRPWTVVLVGLQHGNEPAGREALLSLISNLAVDPKRLPPDTELWVIPTLNPDGLVRDQRRNANDFDLNRDHLILSQPETLALHAFARSIQPDIIIDCHEFRRDTSDYTEQGFLEWPLVMLDTVNSPLLPVDYYGLGRLWVDRIAPTMQLMGINYSRYLVGDAPPMGELRYSTLDADDARNGLSLQAGGLGFIIESGITRDASDPQHDLGERVQAQKVLIWLATALQQPERSEVRSRLAEARNQPLPSFIPTDAFWAEALPERYDRPMKPLTIPVIESHSGRVLEVPAPNLRTTRVVKRRVPTPAGYVIPMQHADLYEELASRHNITTERIDTLPDNLEITRLESLSTAYDEHYHRYAGMQRVVRAEVKLSDQQRESGGVRIDLTTMSPHDARRAIAVFEPFMSFGLYQWPTYHATIDDDGVIPVYRLLPE